ncbi:MAG: hypothetical protein AAFV01_06335 [Bacteroidota bacterium]
MAKVHKLHPNGAPEVEEATILEEDRAPSVPAVTRERYDASVDQWVTSTPQLQEKARRVNAMVEAGVLITSIGLAQMRDEQLYLHLGYNSWTTYCTQRLNMSARKAQRLAQVGRAFQPVLGTSDASPVTGLLAGDTGDGFANEVGGLGLRKLLELSRLDEMDREDLIQTGVVHLADGTTLDLDAIREQSASEFSDLMKAERKARKLETDKLEERNALLEAEAKASAKAVAEAEELKERNRQLEALYGQRATRLADKVAQMNVARENLNRAIEALVRCGVEVDDPLEIRQDLLDLFAKIDSIGERARATYHEVYFTTVEEAH